MDVVKPVSVVITSCVVPAGDGVDVGFGTVFAGGKSVPITYIPMAGDRDSIIYIPGAANS